MQHMPADCRFYTIKEGILLKKVPSKSYKKFWAVLGKSSLYFYKNAKDTQEVGNIPLENIQINSESSEGGKAPFPFELSLPDGVVHYLASNSDEERKEWIQVLSSFIENNVFSDSEEDSVPSPSSVRSTFAFKREKLLLSYRYMKQMLMDQKVPRIIYLPQDAVMHRFGYDIAINKLFKSYSNLDTLYFKDSQFGGDFIMDLIQFLDNHHRITALVFENSGRGGNSCDRFSSSISKLPESLRSLSFIGSLSIRGLQTLIPGIENNEFLMSVTLHSIPVKSELVSLTTAINSSSIEHFSICNTDIGDSALSSMLSILGNNQILRSLTLSQVNLTRNCKACLVNYLISDNSLTSLNLSENKLGDACEGIFTALSNGQQKLLKLNLADIKMTHSSIFSLCKMLQENRTLHTLDISENRLKEESSKVICVALSTNATLCEFRFENAFRSIKKEELNEIKSRIETNLNRARTQPTVTNNEKRRTPLTIIKDTETNFEKLASLLSLDLSVRPFERSLENNTTWCSINSLLEEIMLNPEKDIEDMCTMSLFLLQEIRYTCGSNRQIILEVIKFLCLADGLRDRITSVSDPNTILKSGYMNKKGGKMKNWKRRWFCLSGQFIFYYVNDSRNSHKGTILLEDFKIEGTQQGMTEYSFVIQTPHREYILSCDSDEDRLTWIEAIQTAKSRHTMEICVPLEAVKQQIQVFNGVYLGLRKDPHLQWIIQWWFPICIEILARFYSRRKMDTFQSLFDFFYQQTVIVIYLLTGDYLYDRKLVRHFEGLVRVTYEEGNAKNIYSLRLDAIKQTIVDQNLKSPSILDLSTSWNEVSKTELLLHSDQNNSVNNGKNTIFSNSLLDMDDLAGALRAILDRIDPNILSELLGLSKKLASAELTKSAKRKAVSTLLHGYEYIHDKSSFTELQFPPPCPFTKDDNSVPEIYYFLQEVQPARPLFEPCYKFVQLQKWIMLEWPRSLNRRVTEIPLNDNLYTVRTVFMLWNSFSEFKAVPLSVADMESFNKWNSYRDCIDEIIVHLACCCVNGFDGEDPIITKAFDYMNMATIITMTSIIYSLIQSSMDNK